MHLFHGSKAQSTAGVFSHLGSMLAAAHRLEAMFATRENRAYLGKDYFLPLDYFGVPKRKESLPEALAQFVEFLGERKIVKTDLKTNKPLQLTDCWMDDPVGSGGLEIFRDTPGLSVSQKADLQRLFHPFDGIVYAEHIYERLTPEKLNQLLARAVTNPYFQREFQKREERSLSIGEDFAFAARHEAV